MDDIKNIIKNLLGKIFLTKSVMFGLNEYKITLVVSPSMKIFAIDSRPEKLKNNLPFEEMTFLNTGDLSQWAEENDYEITFSTNSKSLARKLFQSFGNVLVESVSEKKEKEAHPLFQIVSFSTCSSRGYQCYETHPGTLAFVHQIHCL